MSYCLAVLDTLLTIHGVCVHMTIVIHCGYVVVLTDNIVNSEYYGSP